MAIPFYAEVLSNIQVFRATVSVDESIDPSLFVVKDNQLWLEDDLVIDLTRHGIQLVASSLQVQPEEVDGIAITNGQVLYQIKINLRSGSNIPPLEDKPWWTAKTMVSLDWQQIKCRHCDQAFVVNGDNKSPDSTVSQRFKCKELPSEHWYELVECWICHETKPEEHQARMRPILAKPSTLLVGAFYFLVHASDLVPHSTELDQEVANQVKWDSGPMTKWISINCKSCGKVVGEGHYERQQDKELNMMALKLYKYCVTPQPTPSELPMFLNFVVGDLIDAAQVHATHRFIIQGRKTGRVYALLWLFNWDTETINNDGFVDDIDEPTGKVSCQRGMKVLYSDIKDNGSELVKKWNLDKTTDHLIYPDIYCKQLVKFLKSSTEPVPPTMRMMNHPAMPLTKNFSVGFLPRSLS
ncbi:ubiquitin-conjugating enzyme E2-binding protein [Absidia repens]|uniref:Ubiquitin-conjugating enzyme E2-binding protein n=1 Tax=Absidia repens TaxID=90262 RepID=A0A1X2IYQ0_9FUNG|nr:ubiquitin-conjugating enzyme E2-binding protein [Absidia repens]